MNNHDHDTTNIILIINLKYQIQGTNMHILVDFNFQNADAIIKKHLKVRTYHMRHMRLSNLKI